MKPLFTFMIFQAISIFDAAGYSLCKLVQKNQNITHEPYCFAVYDQDTNEYTLHANHDEAKRQFIKNCEQLLKDQPQDPFEF
jgi:hypothetical protein